MKLSSDNPSDRRQFWRSVFHAPVQLTLPDESYVVYLLDISIRGALVERIGVWSVQAGQKCRLRLELSPEEAITMDMMVAHEDPAFLGLHCDHIDLDSMTHLRNLVEFNSGDPAMLGRELSALIATG